MAFGEGMLIIKYGAYVCQRRNYVLQKYNFF